MCARISTISYTVTKEEQVLSSVALAFHGLHHKISDLMRSRPPLPFSVALSVTGLCNSRCKICNIWAVKSRRSDFEAWEWEKLLAQIGPHIKFYTYTGGEPFIREDLPELLYLPFKYGSPYYLTLSTNCLFPERVRDYLERFFEELEGTMSRTKIYCNLSVDGVGQRHDEIRGVEGNFSKVLRTIEYLREIRARRRELKIGVHTVISKFNVNEIDMIYDYFLPLAYVDSMTCEIAEQRHELINTKKTISPSHEDFRKVAAMLMKRLSYDKRLDKTVKSLRISYYHFVDEWLTTGRQPLPCFAGRASCQITPHGKVVSCGVRWLQEGFMGDLRETNYNFRKIWHSTQAALVRKSIRNHECACPLSNSYYTTLACNIITLAKVSFKKMSSQ